MRSSQSLHIQIYLIQGHFEGGNNYIFLRRVRAKVDSAMMAIGVVRGDREGFFG